MAGRPVARYMTREPMTLHPNAPLREAVQLVQVRKLRHVPVLDDAGALVGILSDRDVRRVLPSPFAKGASDAFERVADEVPVERVMTREPMTVGPDTDLVDAVRMLLEQNYGCLPVIDADGCLIGTFGETDALRVLVDEAAEGA